MRVESVRRVCCFHNNVEDVVGMISEERLLLSAQSKLNNAEHPDISKEVREQS